MLNGTKEYNGYWLMGRLVKWGSISVTAVVVAMIFNHAGLGSIEKFLTFLFANFHFVVSGLLGLAGALGLVHTVNAARDDKLDMSDNLDRLVEALRDKDNQP